MTRRHRLIALVAVGAALISGCGSEPTTDEVARVDDQVLDLSTLQRLIDSGATSQLAAQTQLSFDQTSDGEYPAESVRNVITYWAWNAAYRAELGDRNITVDAPTLDQDVTVDALLTDYGAAANALTAVEVNREWTDDELTQRFDELICIDLAAAQDQASAIAFVDAVASGANFAETAQASGYFVQTVGCFQPDQAESAINEFLTPAKIKVEANSIDSLEQGDTVGPYGSEYGSIVLYRPELSSIADTDLVSLKEQAVQAEVLANHDVSVDPLYGWFSPIGLRSFGAAG